MPAPDPFAAWRGEPPVPAPFFLRMLRRLKDWGEPGSAAEDRLAVAVPAAFRIDHPVHSLFWVDSDADYRRAVVGMCAPRMKPTGGPFFFVAFTAAELAAAGVAPVWAAEDMTGCLVANRTLHHNAAASETQLRALCRRTFAANRPAVEVRPKPLLAALFAAAGADGCPISPIASTPCRAAACLALTAAPPGA